MDIQLTRDGEIPVGVQLGWALRARILGGELPVGSRLPGVRELAASSDVNINTVRAVYARLEADGLISVEHGRGTFVSHTAPADGRLAEIARRALGEARTAGLDPREVAAALFGSLTPAGAPDAMRADSPAERRRALRAEIAALERELADERLRRAARDTGVSPARGAGGRILDEAELRAQRDELAGRLAELRAPAPDEPTSSPPAARSTTRPGVVLRPVFSS